MKLRTRIRDYLARRLGVPEIPTSLERIARQGFTPRMIFDVGAYRGGFARDCLAVWPEAEIACFEALTARVHDLKILEKANPQVRVFPNLVGSHEQENVALNEAETASSVLVEQIPQNFPVSRHNMTTVDKVVQQHYGDAAPDLLKIDVQGYELEVLKGAEQTLPRIKAILAEVNLIDIHQQASLIADTSGWLHQRGWGTFDICGLHRRPLDGALWQIDILYVPYSSPLRADKRWGS